MREGLVRKQGNKEERRGEKEGRMGKISSD